MTSNFASFSARIGYELVIKGIDRAWLQHKLPTDDIAIPPKEIPDQDSELNYLLEADESRWQDQRPPNFCFEHRHKLILLRWDDYLAAIPMPSTKSQTLAPFEVDSATLCRLKDERVRDQLVQSLLDGTVHSIVDSLKDLQSIQEQQLWAQREDKIAMLKREGASDEGLTYDNGTILERIDEIVREQQSTLICAGLPLFKSSDEACDLRVQMALIQFILSLGPIYKE
uniref:Uncharacterized protein n=1 Tax=Globodera rostochiensis TaxID=31243 RepID=A0A914H2V2_GLORO